MKSFISSQFNSLLTGASLIFLFPMSWIVAFYLGCLAFAYGLKCDAAYLRTNKVAELSPLDDDKSFEPVQDSLPSGSAYDKWIDCESSVRELCPQSSPTFEWSQCALFNAPIELFAQCSSYLESFPAFRVTIACAEEIEDFCGDESPSSIPDCLLRVAIYSEDRCSNSLHEYFHSTTVQNSIDLTRRLNESSSNTLSLISEEEDAALTGALNKAPMASDSLRGSIDNVLPQVDDGDEGDWFDLWGLMELFFGSSDRKSLDQNLEIYEEGFADEDDSRNDFVDKSDPVEIPSMYSQFLRFAEYMFDSTDDTQDDTTFDDTNASNHLQRSRAM